MTTLTEREQALIGNRANKTPGSTSWSWQTIEALQYMWENLEICHNSYVQLWREAEEQVIWEKVPPEKPYGSKEAMLERLKIGDEDSASAKVAGLAVMAKPLKSNESKRNSSRSADYLTSLIARDHPEIHRRMINGEFKTVADAARAAGIYRPQPKSVGLISDVDRVAANIKKHYTPEQVKALKDAL